MNVMEKNSDISQTDVTPEHEHPVPVDTDGVDVTLIRWMLSLSPEERLKVLQDQVNAITRLRNDAHFEGTGSEKDNAMLPVLRRTRDERERGKSEKPII
ncbi:MAG: hypothetical protein WAV84_01425 [Bacteroidota bacterium]